MNIFREVSDSASEEYNNMVVTSARAYNRHQASLTDILITAALMYLGIVAIVIGSSDILEKMMPYQKVLLGVSVVVFLGSIIFGVITHVRDMAIHWKFYIKYGEFWNDVQMATNEDELASVAMREGSFSNKHDKDIVGLVISIVQASLFILAAVVAGVFVLSFLW